MEGIVLSLLNTLFLMKQLHIYLIIVGICLFQNNSIGQSTMDVFFPQKGQSSLAIGNTSKSYDSFYRGPTLTEGNPADFGSISSTIVSIYGTYSFSDQLTGVINLPYITVRNENGVNDPIQQKSKVSGLQDLSFGVKGKLWEKAINSSKLVVGGGAVVRFPVGNYEEAGILSIGNGAISIEGLALLQYQIHGGLFAELQSGYSLRRNKNFDIPDAFIGEFKIGYAHSKFYLSTAIGRQNSESAFDIGSEEFGSRGGPASLPETEVDYTVLNINGYVPIGSSGFGVTVGYGKVLDGRNAGAESFITGGIVINNLFYHQPTKPRYILGY